MAKCRLDVLVFCKTSTVAWTQDEPSIQEAIVRCTTENHRLSKSRKLKMDLEKAGIDENNLFV